MRFLAETSKRARGTYLHSTQFSSPWTSRIKTLHGKIKNLATASFIWKYLRSPKIKERISEKPPCHWVCIYNDKWIAWSGIWSGIIRAIWNHKSDSDQKLHYPKFNFHLFRPTLKSHNSIAKFAKQWIFCLSFFCNVVG